MTTNEANTAFASLKDFQWDTVQYVLRRLYDDTDVTDHFLVADEVGMGKTLVARGVIAGAIKRLQDDPAVPRIDVIYICSNADIARQNIAKLDVRGDGTRPLSTRITMLATQQRDLNRKNPDGSKTVNLVAFTPGTSFDKGQRRGQMPERAFLWWLLEPLVDGTLAEQRALHRILSMDVDAGSWAWACARFEDPDELPDPDVTRRFRSTMRGSVLLRELRELIADIYGRSHFSEDQRRRRLRLVGSLRHKLAEVSVRCLQPDLVILDEFQRFKHLLEPPKDEAKWEVSQLAQQLFRAANVKVLLLSATPYKMYTLAEERELGDDHYNDFIKTVGFLEEPNHVGTSDRLRVALNQFRQQATTGADPSAAKETVERLLRKVMCRTERPVSDIADMLTSKVDHPDPPTADDLLGFVAMKDIADEVGAQLSIEYWKSAPYFLNFMDGYQVATKFREAEFDIGERRALLTNAQVIRRSDLTGTKEIEPGNARLRQLMAETLDRGLWKLLWVPPSMPYHEPTGAFAEIDPASVTKRLIFSSWTAAPHAIASLLSWTATRRMQGPNPEGGPTRPRLVYRLDEGRPAGMTTLALFVPTPGLAELTDPLTLARQSPADVLPADQILAMAEERVAPHVGRAGRASAQLSPDTWFWAATFAVGGREDNADLAEVVTTLETASDDRGLSAHLQAADEAARGEVALGGHPNSLHRWVALLGLAGPGNVAWRALRRVTAGVPGLTDEGRRQAAAVIAAGFRTLFNRAEVMTLLDSQSSPLAYWQVVLEYCYGGNLQAVLDEYLHHLVGNQSPSTDEALLAMADEVQDAVSLRVAPLFGSDPSREDARLRFNPRFALRYGSAKGTQSADEKGVERMSNVQAAFNAPFWPMVLASTSVGQEGVDFHWWCHSLVHWNLPANPVDFEQREGRVHRFKGHAVRKNVAAAHREEAMRSSNPDPWVAAFKAAERCRQPDMNDLWPWWAYPGDAKIERWIPSFPLSKDQQREERLQRLRALYRLAFGQPRQEDLLTILDQEGYGENEERLANLRIDLRPPRRSHED